MYRGVESVCRLNAKPGMMSLNGVHKLRLTAKETSIASLEVLDVIYRIAVQGIFVGIIIKASAAGLQVTDYIIERDQKSDLHGTLFQPSPKIKRMLITRPTCIQ